MSIIERMLGKDRLAVQLMKKEKEKKYIQKICDVATDSLFLGAMDSASPCLAQSQETNSQQLDADHDSIGDVCDPTPGCGGCGQPACEQQC